MINQQALLDLIPYVWPARSDERLKLINEIKKGFNLFQDSGSSSFEVITTFKQRLAQEGPYFEIYEEFCDTKQSQHKLQQILISLHYSAGGSEAITNLKQNLNPQKLQKLICDIYRTFNRRILDYQAQQIEFAQYTKLSISILKKTLYQNYLDQNCINFICHYASRRCPSLSTLWQEYDIHQHKYTLLAQNLKQIKNLNSPKINCLKQYWNKQQIILCFVLFCIIQCEELIAANFGEEQAINRYEETLTPMEISSDEFSWNYNGFSQIRDYFPKLAYKLNKRFRTLKQMPIGAEQQKIQIFNYTQSLLGYKNNQEYYLLEDDLKHQIKQILGYESKNRDTGLVILVANAKLYTQLMYSLM